MTEHALHMVPAIEPIPEVPMFEGKPVEATRLKVTSPTHGLEIDKVLRMDDIIRVVIEARVSDVAHKVNERTGALIRHQSAKVISAALIPWNPEDPNDEGVLRG